MKKFLIKTIAVILITAILPLAGGLCFQNLANPLKIKTAQAAPNDNDNRLATGMTNENQAADSLMPDLNICNQEQTNGQVDGQISEPANEQTDSSMKEITSSAPATDSHKGLLPCCVDGGHPSVITLSQSFELNKFIPTIIPSAEQFWPLSQETSFYHEPNISPPQLLALRITVLRL